MSMKVLMLTSESVPFSKSGGLADVVGDLSAALANKGNDIRILLPSYGTDSIGKLKTEIQVKMLGGYQKLQIREKEVGKVTYYLLCHPVFCERKGIYGDTSFTPYDDNFFRFTLLNLAPFAFMEKIDFIPDIVHCHDWATGLFSYFLFKNENKSYSKIKTIFTIHNLAYQGIYPKMQMIYSLIPGCKEMYKDSHINLMQVGIAFSDRITTVSEAYSKEIQTPDYGCDLHNLLQARSSRLSGILNGIDVDAWDPEKDPIVKYHFNSEDFSGKMKMKALIQKKYNLKQDENAPLFVMITRLASQKGIEELFEVLDEILSINSLQLLIIGTGNEEYEKFLKEKEKIFNNLSVNIVFSNESAHQVEAGGDFFLMPSRYEPCGLNQMFSQRYGTLVLAHNTGGLSDTIVDIHQHPNSGTGFLMDEITPEILISTVKNAIKLFKSEKLDFYRRNAMKIDFSWNTSALEYIKLYNKTKEGEK